MAASPDPNAETWPSEPQATEPLDPGDVATLDSFAAAEPEQRDPVVIGRVPAIDFAQRVFVPRTSGGGPLMVSGLDALQQWCEKCVRTRRGESPACDPDFGVDKLWTDLLGEPFDAGVAAEFEAIVTDALLVHPAIADVVWGGIVGSPDDDTAVAIYRIVPALEGASPIDVEMSL